MDELKRNDFEHHLEKHKNDLLDLINKDINNKNLLLHNTNMDEVLNAVNNFKDALIKIKNHTFGQCTVCNEEVEPARLEQDITACVCIDHFTNAEIRNLERDLELTAKVQKDLLPCRVPEKSKIHIAHILKPAGIVSGDYYDFFNLANGWQGIVIADVMGKGLPASILMTSVQASIRAIGPETDDVQKIVTRLNKLFCYNLKMVRFISLCIVAIDMENNAIHYTNAGHNPPVLWDSQHKNIKALTPTGPAIGIIKNASYESKTVPMTEDDLLLLYTDGLVEARNAKNEEFGEGRLFDFIKENNMEPAQTFLDKLEQIVISHAGRLQDDLTLVVVKR